LLAQNLLVNLKDFCLDSLNPIAKNFVTDHQQIAPTTNSSTPGIMEKIQYELHIFFHEED
jgi:hypothetical protein